MMSTKSTPHTPNLYDRVVVITQAYFGPATERFLSRQITSHLDKPADRLTRDDLPTLVTWTKLTLAHLTEDVAMIDDYEHQMTALIDSLK